MLHLFLATMDAGHFWSVIAVQMQHLVLYIFFSPLYSDTLATQMLHLQWPASGLSRQMLHLFLATMDAGHFWSVIAVQMQHLVLYIFFSPLCFETSVTA